jgi:hypothetical protein
VLDLHPPPIARGAATTAMADKLNIATNWRAAASPRIAALHDEQGRMALPVDCGQWHSRYWSLSFPVTGHAPLDQVLTTTVSSATARTLHRPRNTSMLTWCRRHYVFLSSAIIAIVLSISDAADMKPFSYMRLPSVLSTAGLTPSLHVSKLIGPRV